MAGKDIAISPQRTVNLYPELDQNYKNPLVLIGFPGLREWVDIGNEARGGSTFKDHAIVVFGSGVYKLEKGGSWTSIGNLSTSSGIVEIAENGLELVIVDGKDGFVWDGVSFDKIIDPVFTQLKADSVTYLDDSFIVNRPGTGQIFASDALDAKTFSATKTTTAEYKSDPVNKVWVDRELILGGTETLQVYYNSGATPMPFEPDRQGRLIYGVAAKNSVIIMDNTTHGLFQNKDGGIFAGRMDGYTVTRVSTRSLERFWSGIDYADAYAFGIHWKGHEFYIITFPLADTGLGRTFGYDASTKLWFELGDYESGIGDFRKYTGTFHLFFGGRHLIGADDGKIYETRDDVFLYGSKEIVSLRRCPVLHRGRERLFFNTLQIDMDVGVGTNSGQGLSPVCRLEISDDGGKSFKNFRNRSIGQHGETEQRVKFTQLGSSYDRVYQLSISDPVTRKLIDGYTD